MSNKIDDGGSAFPVPGSDYGQTGTDYGMTIRDYFAAKAMPPVDADTWSFVAGVITRAEGRAS